MIKIEGQPSLFLLDLKGKEYSAMAEVNRKKRVNGQREISLSFLYDEVNGSFLHDIDFGWKLLFKGEWYTITSPTYALDGDRFSVGVDAVLSFFVDMNGHYLQDEVEDKSMTPAAYFTELFQDTGYNFVLVDNLAANTLNYQANQSKTERFLYGIDRFKGEYIIRGKQAYIHNLIGSDKDVILHEDLNIADVSIEVDASGFHTWAKGFGDKDDSEQDADYKLEVSYESPLIAKHGYIEGPAIRDGKYKKAAELKEAVKKQVENSYKISSSIDAVDLTNNGYPEMQFEEGDRVWLYVTDLKQNQQVRVMEIDETFDWEGNIIDARYTLGNEGIATRYKTQQYNTLKDFSDILNGKKKIEKSWLDDAVQRASDIINGNLDSHFEYGPGEIIGINRDNPNGYMRFNTDGLGFSRDGGKTYRSAITYEGIVADAITAGTLRSILIEGVEIHGSKFISRFDNDTYTEIEGASVMSRGRYTRTWFGETTTHDVGLRMFNGYFRAENFDENKRLYYSDKGIHTFLHGYDDEDPNTEFHGSGVIEFFSHQFHPDVRGLTLFSNRGTIGLKTNTRDIVLDADRSVQISTQRGYVTFTLLDENRAGNNHFQMYVHNNPSPSDTDGLLRYGSPSVGYGSGLRFQKTSAGQYGNVWVTDGSGAKYSGKLIAGAIEMPNGPSNILDAYNIRSNRIRTITEDSFMYLGTDLGVRVTSRGTNDNDPIIYRDIQAADFQVRSSRLSKENIRKSDKSGLESINNLTVIEFDYIDGDKDKIGFEAESSSDIATDDEGFISLSSLFALHTLALQEMSGQLNELQTELDKIKGV